MKLIRKFLSGFSKGMSVLKVMLGILVVFVVMGAAVPIVWPMIVNSGADIAALTQTDAGTTFIQGFWPLALLFAGIAIAVGIIVFVVKKVKT